MHSGFAVGIYTTNSPDACQYVAHNAECNIIVVENDRQLQKIIEVRKRLPHLRAIIQYIGVPKQQYPNVYTVCLSYLNNNFYYVTCIYLSFICHINFSISILLIFMLID